MTSATTPISSPLSSVSACPLVLLVPILLVSAIYISTSAASVLLLSLTPVLIIVQTVATDIALPSKIASLVACPKVIVIADVFHSHLSAEGWV